MHFDILLSIFNDFYKDELLRERILEQFLANGSIVVVGGQFITE